MNLFRDIGSALSSIVGNSLEQQARDFANYIITKSEKHYHKEARKTSFFGLIETYDAPKVISEKKRFGYCIRTARPIPFNINHPMCDEAYQSWSRYKDENYREKFCHFSGEPSNGETSVSRPILKKNWRKAQEIINNDLPF